MSGSRQPRHCNVGRRATRKPGRRLEQKAFQAADAAAKTLSQVALWAVVALALEALPRRLAGPVGLHAISLPPLSGKHKT